MLYLDAAHFVPPYVALSRSDKLSLKENESNELQENDEKFKVQHIFVHSIICLKLNRAFPNKQIWTDEKNFDPTQTYLPDYNTGSSVLPIIVQISNSTTPLGSTDTIAENLMGVSTPEPLSLSGILLSNKVPLPSISETGPIGSSTVSIPTSLDSFDGSSKPELLALSEFSTVEETQSIALLPSADTLVSPFPGPSSSISLPASAIVLPTTVPFSGSMTDLPLSSTTTTVTLPTPAQLVTLPRSIISYPVTCTSLPGLLPNVTLPNRATSVPQAVPVSTITSAAGLTLSNQPQHDNLPSETSGSSSNELFFRQLLPEVALRLKLEFPQSMIFFVAKLKILEYKEAFS